MRATAILLATILMCGAAAAGPIRVDHGDIQMNGHTLTRGGHDSEPLLSPDGKRIVFLRATGRPPVPDCAGNGDAARAVELWSMNVDGSGAHKLLATRGGQKVETVICDFASKQFDSTGMRLYFETPAWATSGAVHVYDFRTNSERLFLPGDGLKVLANCRDPKYRNDIVTTQHRYFVFSGSYDWAFLFTPAGKEVGPLGDGDFTSDLADACG